MAHTLRGISINSLKIKNEKKSKRQTTELKRLVTARLELRMEVNKIYNYSFQYNEIRILIY